MEKNDISDLHRQFEEGKRAIDAGDDDIAFNCLLPCAEAGNAEAQAIVGFLLYTGIGVEHDHQQAVKWLLLAIDQGRGDAAHNLATLYLTCEPEFPRKQAESRNLYLKARDLGFIVAPDEWYEQLRDQQVE